MAGLAEQGDNYNLPNYTGQLFQLTPSDTPFLSAIGGLNGAEVVNDTRFSWETFDLSVPAAYTGIVEGANAQTEEARVRAQVYNVVEIHQRTIDVAYSKMGATQRLQGIATGGASNPITDEVDWQVQQVLKQVAMQADYNFLNGTYVLPANNSTGRQTRGLLAAISTNTASYGTASAVDLTATASTDVINETSTGRTDGDAIKFVQATGAAGITLGKTYYVVGKATNTFQIAERKGGAAVDITTNGTAIGYVTLVDLTKAHVDDLLQKVYESGGIMDTGAATLLCNGTLKRGLSEAYTTAGQTPPDSRTVGGVAVDTIVTDFGTLNVMLDRYMPHDTLVVASLDQCRPVVLNVPGKGSGFFVEPLAKVSAANRFQLYGEIGLRYGSELSHGKATGLGR